MIDKTELKPTLKNIPWLMDLSVEQINLLEKIAGVRYLDCGEVLFHEGDNDNVLYIVSEGRLAVEILVPRHGQVCIYYAEPLDLVGWDRMTPVARQRITSITATQKSFLICMDAAVVSELCESDPKIGMVIMRRLSNVIASRLLSMRIKLLELLAEE
ncbi:MAG: Crp/Fnr family transcriptional regulator [Anaerolineaceae bacterium]